MAPEIEEDDTGFKAVPDKVEVEEDKVEEEVPEKEPEVPTFKLTRKFRKIKIELVEGKLAECTVWEVPGNVISNWKNFMQSRMKFDKVSGQPIGIKDFTGLEAELVHFCLRTPSDKAIPKKTIADWPSTTLVEIHKICLDLNGLTPESEEAEKKT